MREITNGILAVITIAISVALMAEKGSSAESEPQSTWRPRPVGAEEIQESRGEIEDRLRKEVLGAFTDKEQLTRLRNILNGPWNKAAVENLGSFVLDNTPLQGQVTIVEMQWGSVANMIAYVGKEYPETPAGAAAKEVLDKFVERAILTDRRQTVMACFWLLTTDAIARYGTAGLLPESFWKGIEQGMWASGVLESVGDEGVLKRFKSIRAQNPWPQSAYIRTLADETVLLIEMQIEYPELKQLNNRGNSRYLMGKMLHGVKKENRAQVIEKLAGAEKNADWRRVLDAISARLKKEAAASPQNK